MAMTRAEHLKWTKNRALEYVNMGDKDQALISMMSDLGKHQELRDHAAIQLTTMMISSGLLNDMAKVRQHIEGLN